MAFGLSKVPPTCNTSDNNGNNNYNNDDDDDGVGIASVLRMRRPERSE